MSETKKIMKDKKLYDALLKARKKGSKTSPYEPLIKTSSLEKLEEAIKNRPSHTWIRRNLDKAEEIDWAFVKIKKEFVAFKKDHDSKIHEPRKQLEERKALLEACFGYSDFPEYKLIIMLLRGSKR